MLEGRPNERTPSRGNVLTRTSLRLHTHVNRVDPMFSVPLTSTATPAPRQ